STCAEDGPCVRLLWVGERSAGTSAVRGGSHVAIFDRIRRARGLGRAATPTATPLEPIAEHLLPEINQRVTIAVDGAAPVSSRVEDVRARVIQLAFPALELEFADAVTVAWEREGVWMSLVTN